MNQLTPQYLESNAISWEKALEHSILRICDLPAGLGADRADAASVAQKFSMKINAYFAALIHSADDPLGRQVIPRPDEGADAQGSQDPLSEEYQSPAPQVIHRYPRRVVLLVSNQCAVHCRFCMRKRRVAENRQVARALIDQGVAYIRSRPLINEVVLSGGDPLMLGDLHLFSILKSLREIPHVRLLRIHTRMPSVLPQRITAALAEGLRALRPLYINIHFNHPAEITPAAVSACSRLADAGMALGSQTVLLKGINDRVDILRDLLEGLLVNGIRPYYLHQLDRVPGTAHFRVPLEEALQIMSALRGTLSGMAMPHFMIDLPGGGGKVALVQDAVVQKGAGQWRVRNWRGEVFTYDIG